MGTTAIRPTPAMLRYGEELGYGERFTLNRLWEFDRSRLDVGRLFAAARKVEAECADLRMRIKLEGRKILEAGISDGPAFEFDVRNAGSGPSADIAIEEGCLDAQGRKAMDGRSPLYGLTVHRTGERSFVHLCFKHLALDDRGIANLVRRLNAAYADPDAPSAPPASDVASWSAALGAHAAASPAMPRDAVVPLPRFLLPAADALRQQAAEEAFGGYSSDAASRRFYLDWKPEGAPDDAARAMRALMVAIPTETDALLHAIRKSSGLDFDVFAQALAQAWKTVFGRSQLHADVLRSMRKSAIGDISDGLFLANEHLPQLLEAADGPGIAGLKAQKAARRDGFSPWLAWRTLRQAALSDGSSSQGDWPSPDIVLNYRLESDRNGVQLLGAARSGLFVGENHNHGRTACPLGFWLQACTIAGRTALILEWEPHAADHPTAQRLLAEVVSWTARIAERTASVPA